MSANSRVSEKIFNVGLWAIAIVFASFLIGLGGAIVGDLPRVESTLLVENFIDEAQEESANAAIRTIREEISIMDNQMAIAQMEQRNAEERVETAQDSFNNWIATRRATGENSQNTDLVNRTKELDILKSKVLDAEQEVISKNRQYAALNQQLQNAQATRSEVQKQAEQQWREARQSQEIRVFIYRLLITLPLLLIGAWLFVKKRKTQYWPFVWGFILFALFAFFVELVPYLPDYGGYIRYAVGIIGTGFVGHYSIKALRNYLETLKAQEALPETARREKIDYDIAISKMNNNICPGCERGLDLKNMNFDFCPHCGIGLHDYCKKCKTRKSTFFKFCYTCGAESKDEVSKPPANSL